MTAPSHEVRVRNTRAEDIPAISALCRLVYPQSPPWTEQQILSHLSVFPEGQFVAVRYPQEELVGMAASLIVSWNDYDITHDWRDFTDHGMFTNHDPEDGRTLYAAEVMVDPSRQGRGVGSRLYAARRELTIRLGLRRIRAGARLRGYHRYASAMTAEEYAIRVSRGEVYDPTVSFQLRRGFHIIAVVSEYLRHDPESLGYAAVIEWLNSKVATFADRSGRDPRFGPLRPSRRGV